MKLSDIRGDKTLDVIAELIVPVSNIASDPDMRVVFQRGQVPEGKTAEEMATERLRNAAPKVLKRHKDDVITILAAVSLKDREQYLSGLNLASLMSDLYELINDSEFVGFFSSVVSEETSIDG